MGCSTIQFKEKTNLNLPALGTIGVFKDYSLQKITHQKTITSLSSPVRLSSEKIKISPRALFVKKESKPKRAKDSTLISFKIMDQVNLLQQINENKELFSFLKNTNNHSIVTEITMSLSTKLLDALDNADELYLVHRKESTLSIELRKDRKKVGMIEFDEGEIVDYEVSNFCWGTPKGFKVAIIDLIPKGASCGDNLYSSSKKAGRINEIGF
jgi:hypothetical protein